MNTATRNAKAIESLDPVFQPIAESIIRQCVLESVDVLITDGHRSLARQLELYNDPKVFAAAPGYSLHNYGMAIDVVPLTNGKPDYGNTEAYKIIGKVAKRHGCEWGGDWKQQDKPHIQYTQGLTIADVRAGKSLTPILAPQDPSWMFQYLSPEQNIIRLRKALARSSDMRARSLKRGIDRILSWMEK